MNKLALAKEMFVSGIHNSKKNTRINKMLAILNFDFASTALIVSACIDSGENTKQNNGKVKKWDDLLASLRRIYPNQSMIADIDSLHDLRNSIQHGDVIPSDWDINRFVGIIRSFFDDVCVNVYQNRVTFTTMSLAQILTSKNESQLMIQAEKFLEDENYNLSLYLIQTTILYHYLLIRENLSIPPDRDEMFSHRWNYVDNSVKTALENLSKNFQTAVDKFAMGEFHSKMLHLLKNVKPFLLLDRPYYTLSNLILPNDVTFDEVENYKNDAYSIILGTEYLFTERTELEGATVCSVYATDITDTSITINYAILSDRTITDTKLGFIRRSTDSIEFPEPINLPNDLGFQKITISNLHSDTEYTIYISTNYSLDPTDDFPFIQSHGASRDFKFRTRNRPS